MRRGQIRPSTTSAAQSAPEDPSVRPSHPELRLPLQSKRAGAGTAHDGHLKTPGSRPVRKGAGHQARRSLRPRERQRGRNRIERLAGRLGEARAHPKPGSVLSKVPCVGSYHSVPPRPCHRSGRWGTRGAADPSRATAVRPVPRSRVTSGLRWPSPYRGNGGRRLPRRRSRTHRGESPRLGLASRWP